VAACAAQQAPPQQAQLATTCNGIAAAYNTAAAYKAQGKLSPASIQLFSNLEAPVQALCDPNNPPADLTTALQDAEAYLNELALANAGVK
jgi:hypothetical protein